MKIFEMKIKLILLLLMMLCFNSIELKAQASPNCKSSVSSTNGANSLCSGNSLLLWYGDTSSGKKVYQWFTGSHPNLVPIAGATKPQLLVTSGNTYYVRVVDTSISHSASTDTGYCFRTITLNTTPNSNFTYTPNTGVICGATLFNFTGVSQTGCIYDWTFGDINFNQSSVVSPTHTYIPTASGSATNYTVTLIVKNANSTCYDTTKKTISIGAGPDAKLDENSTITYEGKATFTDCSGGSNFTFTFTNNSSTSPLSISNYKIVWGDATPDFSSNSFTSTTHIYPIGLYTLKYVITGNNGCTNTKEYFVFVGTNPAVGFGSLGNTDICTGASLTFPINSVSSNPPGTTYIVHYSDGSADTSFSTYPPPTLVTHIFNTSSCGTTNDLGQLNAFSAKITAVNPCSSTPNVVGSIRVSLKPQVGFSSSLPIDTTCENSTVTFTNTSNIGVMPYSNSNCNSGNIVWDISPATGWTITSGSLGVGISTTNPNTWTSGSSNISINFTTAGTYTIKLRGSGFNTKCGYDSLVKTICVNPTPTSSFYLSKSTICLGDTATAISTANIPLCGNTTYQWSISYAAINGCTPSTSNVVYTIGSDTSAKPQFRFDNPGTYTISLVTAIKGTTCTSTSSSQSITVKGKPNIGINNISSVCQGENIAPSAATPTCYISSATFNWTFAGGNPATANTLVPGNIQMNSSGSNTVSLSATNECGTTSTQTIVTIKPIPAIGSATPHNPSQCTLQDGSIDLSGLTTGTTYTITYTKNGGATITIPNKVAAGGMVTITGLGSGVYDNIKVSVGGCFSNPVGPVSLSDPNPPTTPTVSSNSPLCSGATLNLTANTTTTGAIVYSWSGPNTFTSPSQNPNITSTTTAATGTYSVTATLAGCTSAAGTVTVTINQTPATPAANYNSPICSGATLNLTSSTTTSGTINYAWTGPNSFVSAIQNPSITNVTTAASGSYNVIATATPSNCASVAGTLNVTVKPTPNISNSSATNPNNCGGADGKIILEGLAFNTSYNVVYTKNGTTITPISLSSNASGILTITGLSSGLYTNVSVSLNGCPSNIVGSFTLVDPNPPATPTITAVANICSGKNLTLSATTSSSGTATYNWSGPNGFTATGTPLNINNIPTKLGGPYSVTATISGCTSSAGTATIAVDSTPVTPAITGITTICSDSTLQLTASTASSGAMTYNWTGPNSYASNTASITINNIVASNAGTYNVTATSSAGCISSIGTTNVTVNATPIISNITSVNPSQCASATGLISFSVIPATGTYTVNYSKNGVNKSVTISAASGIIKIDTLRAGTYSNITVTLNNCPSNVLGPITLTDPNPPATPTITAVDSICSGDTLSLSATTTSAGLATYNWSSTSGFSAIGTSVSISNISTLQGGTFNVTATISNCVSLAGIKVIRVDSTPVKPTIASNSPVCSDSTIKLSVTNNYNPAVAYSWTGANNYINATQNVVINLAKTINAGYYKVFVTSNFNCKSIADSVNVIVNQTPIIAIKDSSNPTQCASATGFINLNGLLANTFYDIHYTINSISQTQNQKTDANGILKIDTLRAGTYSNIYVVLNACPSNIVGAIVLKDPTPPTTPTITGVDSTCSGKTLILNATTSSSGVATYDWSATSGFIGTGASISIPNITMLQGGTYSVAATINQCKSIAGIKDVRIDSTPVKPVIVSNNPVCSDSSIQLSTSNVYPFSVIYNWSFANSTINNNQSFTIANAQAINAGFYKIVVTSNFNCISLPDSVNIIVNKSPSIGIKDSTNPNQCTTPTGFINLNGLNNNTTYNIYYTINSSVKMQTQTSDGSGVLRLDTLRAGTYSNIYVTLNGCPSKPVRTITLVDPTPPATPVITAVDSICSGNNLSLSAVTTSVGTITYQWSGPTGFNSIGATVSFTNIPTNASGQYSVTATINNCTSLPAFKTIRVDSTPITPMLSSNSPICTDSTIQLFATTVYAMQVTYSWTGVNGFTSTQQNPTIPIAILVMSGNYNAYVTSIVGNCQSPNVTTPVVINESPNVAQLNDTTYKDGTNSGNIIFTGTVANTTFNWVNSNTTIGLAASGAGTINFNATNTTPYVIFGLVTVTPSTPFCTGKPMTFKITVNPTPTLSSKLKDTICTENLYTYQATSVTPNVKYTWDRNVVAGITNAASASTDSSGVINETLINTTSQPIDVIYNFKLYSLSSVNTLPFVLTVTPNAKAAYSFASDKLCTPAHIDTSNIKVQDFPNANGSYEWYANDTLIGTGINFPSYTIKHNGDTIYIKLKAISVFGCKADSFEHKFYTVKTPTVSFIKSVAKGCGPLSVDFTNTTTPLNAPTYFWDFGNGQTSTQQSPTNIIFIADTSYNRHDTTYYITLTAITQCDTIKFMDSVTVLPKPRALFQPDTTVGCSVFHFRAFNNSLGTHNTYTWDFGDSTALVIDTSYGYYYHDFKVTNTDTFNVKLKAVNACGADSFTINVVVFPNTIVPKLIADGTNNFGCAPVNIRFINNTRGANKFTVNFGDGSLPYISTNNPDTIYHYYANGGNYTATLKAQNSCTDSTVASTITLYNKPAASFSTLANQYCKNDNIHFTNTSDTSLSFYWSFGDGITSTAVHPNHTYTNAGNYIVSLVVKSTNASGAVCTDTATKNIIIHDIPSATFTTNAVLQNCQPYIFQGIAANVIGNIYNWKFYDASSIDTTKAGAVGFHTFNNIGTYQVRLIVFNSFGCSDTSFTNVKVIETPKALFTLSDSVVCVPGKFVNCINKTTYTGTDALNFEWYVGGVQQSTTTNFSYNFTANSSITTAVIYNVKLVVTNSFGCKDSIIKKVVIQPKAIASFQINATQGCAPFSVQVNNSSLYANIFKWYVDGNLVSVAASPSPLQLSVPAKTYIIKLVADYTLGCGADSTVLQVVTYPKPVADFQIPITASCNGTLNINCFDLSNVIGGTIQKWSWSFGDGKTDTIQNPSHTYNVAGAFSVSLWVKDDKNCVSDVVFKTVKNFGKPKANFTVGNVCLGSDVVPVNLSTGGFGSTTITSYLWNFGDGAFLTGNQPVHKYNAEGNYSITLTVTADSSCIADTITKPVTIYGKPTAGFSFNNNCVHQPTQFINNSLFGFGQNSIGNSTWNFGDGLTSNVKDAQHIYAAASSFNVKLQVSGNRCPNLIDTTTKIITINQPRSNIVYPRIEGTRGTPIQLNAANDGVSYQWLPTTALNNALLQNPIANFAISSPNIVNYQIKVTDSFGCVATDRQEIWLFVGSDIYLPTAFTPNGDNANDLFKPLYINIQKIQYFRVFDRWGKIVFETSDMSKSWDGTLAGKELPTDTYVWTIAGFTNDGTEIIRKGNVTLIRN